MSPARSGANFNLPALVLGGGFLLVLGAYGPRLSAPLIWDDRAMILYNEVLQRPVSMREIASPAYFKISNEYSWRPLSTLSYRFVIKVFGVSPAALRGLSLLLHLLNGFLLWSILDRWGWPKEAAAWGVALFWLHPAQVESMMCAAFNKEALTAFCFLCMLTAHQRRRWWLAGIAFTWALLAKEAALAALPMIVLFDVCAGGRRLLRSHLAPLLGYGAIALAYAAVRFVALPGPAASLSAMIIPPSERMYYALGGWLSAVRTFALPLRLRIEYFALPAVSAFDWLERAAAGAALLAAVGAGGVRLWRIDRKLAWFWLWPWPFLLLTSNLIPAGALNTRLMAERWLYLPIIGWSVVFATLVFRKTGRSARPALATLVVALSVATIVRAADWSDEIRLWTQLQQIYPWSAKAAEGAGEALARANRCGDALPDLRRAYLLREDHRDPLLVHYVPISGGLLRWESPSLYRWLGECEAKTGQRDLAATHFEKSIILDQSDVYSCGAMALAYAEAREYRKARTWVDRGLRRDPANELLLRIKARLPK